MTLKSDWIPLKDHYNLVRTTRFWTFIGYAYDQKIEKPNI